MDRAREIGEGSSSSPREQRNLREKERRERMKHLYDRLSSHISPTRRLSVPQLIDQAKSYMNQLKEKVEHLKEKKTTLVLGGAVQNRSQGLSLLPKLSIHSRDSTIHVNLIMDLNMKRVMLHELVSVFEEQGAQVMSAHLHTLNDRIFYTIIAQAIIYRIGIDLSEIEKKLRDIIF